MAIRKRVESPFVSNERVDAIRDFAPREPTQMMRRTHNSLPYLWTPVDREIQAAIQQCLSQVSISKPTAPNWFARISVKGARDFFGDLLAAGLIDEDQSWTSLRNTAVRASGPLAPLLVNQAAVDLEERLKAGILAHAQNGISATGGVLYYTDRADRCLVFEYNLDETKRGAAIKPSAQILGPDYLYDIDSAVADVTPATRSSLKNAVVFGHKIVAHRNTLIHVDRRRDIGTAGPFIDTIILNEMLHAYVYEQSFLPDAQPVSTCCRKALEIGCGNGLLIVSAAQNLQALHQIVAIDPNVHAISCAHRNFAANLRGKGKRLISLVAEFGDVPLTDFDLVLCNPPYIPRAPHLPRGDLDAIMGTELLSHVIANVPKLLSPSGSLFMIFSALADMEFDKAVSQSGVTVKIIGPPGGFRVRFEQPEVLRSSEERDFLLDRGLEYTQKNQEYHHVLRCAMIHRSLSQGYLENTRFYQHIEALNSAFTQRSY